jgi:glycine betaine/proline transport system substrate-binding protein
VTKATADELGITHMDQINDDPALAALFDTDGDGSANIYGCQLGLECDNIMNSMIAFSGWDKIEQDIGNYDAMFASALEDVNRGQSMILYMWAPTTYSEQMVPGQNVVWLSVELVLDDSNPLGEDGGESYDQRPGTAPIGPSQCPGVVGGICQLGWDTWDICAFANAGWAI